MAYITVQEARDRLNRLEHDTPLCPDCYSVLEEKGPGIMMCPNEMCLNGKIYKREGDNGKETQQAARSRV